MVSNRRSDVSRGIDTAPVYQVSTAENRLQVQLGIEHNEIRLPSGSYGSQPLLHPDRPRGVGCNRHMNFWHTSALFFQ
jgi:hypothetical protein